MSLVETGADSEESKKDKVEKFSENSKGRIFGITARYVENTKQIVVEGYSSNYNKENIIKIQKAEVLIVKHLQCERKGMTRTTIVSNNSYGLPVVCHYKCTLEYEILNKNFDKKNINIKLYIVIVPVTMTQRLDDSTIVLFREKQADMDMESALRASMLEGLAASLLGALKEFSKNFNKNKQNIYNIILFYDTTHGVNTLLLPFSYAYNVIDKLIILELAGELLKAYNSNREFKFGIQSYLYNSDPVQLGGQDELAYLKITSKSNISYYYYKFTTQSKFDLSEKSLVVQRFGSSSEEYWLVWQE